MVRSLADRTFQLSRRPVVRRPQHEVVTLHDELLLTFVLHPLAAERFGLRIDVERDPLQDKQVDVLGTELQRKMIRECGDRRRHETVRMNRLKRCSVSSGRHLAAGVDQRIARDIPQDVGEGHSLEITNWLQVWRHLGDLYAESGQT